MVSLSELIVNKSIPTLHTLCDLLAFPVISDLDFIPCQAKNVGQEMKEDSNFQIHFSLLPLQRARHTEDSLLYRVLMFINLQYFSCQSQSNPQREMFQKEEERKINLFLLLGNLKVIKITKQVNCHLKLLMSCRSATIELILPPPP